jgi:hypothetical protein
MHLATAGHGPMPIWTRGRVWRLFPRKTELAPCKDGFTDQDHGNRDLRNDAGALNLSWLSVPQDNGGGRPAYEVVMIGIPRWL